jgi:hypothetical protein
MRARGKSGVLTHVWTPKFPSPRWTRCTRLGPVLRPASIVQSSLAVLATSLACSVLAGCAPRPRMCTASLDCSGDASCVAGRCQPSRANLRPAIDNARRLVVWPVDAAYVRRGKGSDDGLMPSLFALGVDDARLFLRFSVAVPSTANIVEAYLVLRRAAVVDDDPAPISLHVTRIVEPWESRSTSWALQPRLLEVRAPMTVVKPAGPNLVRLDVRDLVRQWGKRDPRDHGLAVVADEQSLTGTTFAFTSAGLDGRPLAARDVEPYLELYVR